MSDSEPFMAQVSRKTISAFTEGMRVRYDPDKIQPIMPDPEGDYVVIGYQPAVLTDTRRVPRFVLERRAAAHP